MGRITDPGLQALAEAWSPVVLELLDEVGQRVWPPHKERRGLFGKPVIITRYSLEGPAQRSGQLLWALSHTSQPSTFDEYGTLSEGEREFWLVALQPGSPPLFSVEGARLHERIPVDSEALLKALNDSRKEGPKTERFYGNKGPLSHR
jgi:hypothetical protein